MNKFCKAIIGISLLSLLSGYVLADVTLGDAVSTLVVGGDVLSKIMWAACIIVGIALLAAGFTQFQIHRQNPKLVPLTTPVLYLILGVCAVAIPFIDRMKDFVSNSKQHMQSGPAVSKQKVKFDPNDIDAPLN